jgi:hypothetical protein
MWVRRLCKVASAVLIGATIPLVLGVSPASAAAGSIFVTPTGNFGRGGTAVTVSIDVPAAEGEAFSLTVDAPDMTSAIAGTCNTTGQVPAVPCSVVPVPSNQKTASVTIGDNASAPAGQLVTAHFTAQMTAAATIGLTSIEATSVPSASRTITAVVSGLAPGQTPTAGTATATIVPAANDAVIAIATANPTPDPAPRGGTTTYSAVLTRSGNTSATTNANVSLVADSAAGTSVDSTSTPVVFDAGETTEPISATVSVPANAAAGPATYHFVVTYDPTGSDGTPVDTETGDPKNVALVDPPNISLALSTNTPTSTELTRHPSGSTVTFTATVTNSAPVGSAPATNVIITFPTPGQTTAGTANIGGTAASNGSVDNGDALQRKATFTSVSPGQTAILSVPVSVNVNATKVSGAANDIIAGPATVTWQPLNGQINSTPASIAYELRPEADLDMIVSDPADGGVPISVDYSIYNIGADPSAASTSFAAPAPSGVSSAPAVTFDTAADWGCSVNVSTYAVTCVYEGGTGNPAPLAGGATTSVVHIAWSPTTNGGKTFAATASSSTFDPDTTNNSENQTATVTVNTNPVANDDTAQTISGQAVLIKTLSNDTDAQDGTPLFNGVTDGVENGTLSCTTTGHCTYTPNSTFVGVDKFTYQVKDSSGALDTAIATINVFTPPSFSVTGGSGPESGNAQFVVSLAAPAPFPLTVRYDTANGTATTADYATTRGVLTFNTGESSKTVNVPVLTDTIDEPNENFKLALRAPSAGSLATSNAKWTINDDDAPPAITIGDAAILEGRDGTQNMTFTVGLSSVSSRSITVKYRTSNNTATSEGDFTAVSGMVTFDPGETSKTITVAIVGDRVVEPDETFYMALLSPTNATIADAVGIGLILNDD